MMRFVRFGLVPLALSCGGEARMAPSADDVGPAAQEKSMSRGGEGGYFGGAEAEEAPASAPVVVGAGSTPMEADGVKDEDLRQGNAVAKKEPGGKGAGGDDGGPATRAWFPESFLWQPLAETNAAGTASVAVTVPDTLTTWRVLALAQSARGGQGGATTTFRSTMPAYVELVTPSFLYAGDRVQLPVQVVNQEGGDLRAPLDVTVRGGRGGAGGSVALAGYATAQRPVQVDVGEPGSLVVGARLGDVDAVERTVAVRPVGRAVEMAFGGTLGGPRSLLVDGVPGGRFGSVEALVFPGALSVVQRELALADGRGSDAASSAYAFALSRAGAPLVGEGEVTADALRTVALHAMQRITRVTRAPDPATAAAVLPGLTGVDPTALEGRLAERLRDTLLDAQQDDGLWGVAPGATVDQALVFTARCAWALGPDAKGARLRATGATERFAERMKDPVVAAWALAAGIVEPGAVDAARATVRDALVQSSDGARHLPGGRLAADGEATAVAILALADDPTAEVLRADLASGLLGRWSPRAGFGGGQANLVALRALAVAMGGEIPRSVKVTLTVDDREVAVGALDPAQPHAPISLRAPGFDGAGSHTVVVQTEPAVPGLAFTLTSRSYVPWVEAEPAGLDLVVTPPARPQVGVPASVDVRVSGPADARVDVDIGLPAGVDPDRAGLASVLGLGACDSWRAEDGAVHVEGLRLTDGAVAFSVPVLPTLAGELASGPSTVRLGARAERVRAPTRWTIR